MKPTLPKTGQDVPDEATAAEPVAPSEAPPMAGASMRHPPPLHIRVLGALLSRWLKIRQEPSDPVDLIPTSDLPTVYVVERQGLSDTLILDQATFEAGLPTPYAASEKLPIRRRRSVVALSPRPRLFRRSRHSSRSETLRLLLDHVRAHPESDVRVVPVSIFVGRAPDREEGWFRVLFSENWVVVGRFQRLLALLLNGRSTVVRYSKPVLLSQVIADAQDLDSERTVRKLSRVLRVHFRRIRAAVIGPDLSHRRTVADSILDSAPVREAIASTASKDNISPAKAWRRARHYVREIAADYSHPVVRSLSFLLKWFWNKLYDGVTTYHLDKLQDAIPGHEVIYVPCHRSHIDYILLSYQLYQNNIVPPHIAAGVNLNLPVVGSILRRGGAFFLRRSFKGNALYTTVFSEYVAQLFARGVSLEYFIEGGRSRTGRLLAPRGGMLAMTLRGFLRESRRPVMFQPVYVGYEKLMEGKSYIGELSGGPKQKETLFALFRSLRVLRKSYGRVALSFGEPIYLKPLLDEIAPDWTQDIGENDRPEWMANVVDTLAERIQININRAAHVNPINLIALALLSSRTRALAEADLIAQIALCKALLTELPYSERVTITALEPGEIIAYAEQMQWIERVSHPLGDVLRCSDENAVLLSYFRNNVQHLLADAAWVACCFLNNRRMARENIQRLGRLVYPFIQNELFLRWTSAQFSARIDATADFFVKRGLLDSRSEGATLGRSSGQTDKAYLLRGIAHSLLQTFERHYIAVIALVRHGRGSLSAGELENLCHLTAQRLSLLNEVNGPEFFDKALFRAFIQKLRERRIVWTDDAGKLDYDQQLEDIARDARVVLSREIRHGILKLTADKRSAIAEQHKIEKTTAEPMTGNDKLVEKPAEPSHGDD